MTNSSAGGLQGDAQDKNTLDIASFIDQRPISRYQLRVVLICFIVAMIDGFDVQAVAFVAPLLSKEMGFGAQGIGNLYSSGLFGLMIGALGFGALADRIGRKPVILISCLLMGIFSLLSATSGSLNELLIYRFLTGLGLGAAMPNINSLTAEYSPKRRQAFLMTLMFAGFPAGAVLGGMLSVKLIELYSWPSVFVLGGVAPILLVIVVFKALPESLRFRAARDQHDPTIGETLKMIDKDFLPRAGMTYSITEAGPTRLVKAPIVEIFHAGRASSTFALWLLYGANFLMMYSVLGWLPTIMSNAGLGVTGGIYTAVSFNLGAIIGGLTFALALDRQMGFWPISIGYILATGSTMLLGTLGSSLSWALAVVFLNGLTLMGGAFALNAITAAFYPTTIRATGLGTALAVGRLGAIFGPMLIGAAMAANLPVVQIFIILAVPGVFCAIAILWLGAKKKKMELIAASSN